MKNKLVLLGLILILVLCNASMIMADEVTVVKVWANDAHMKDLTNRLVEKYNSTIGEEKGIRIEYKVFGSGFNDTLKLASSSGSVADIFKLPNAMLRNYANTEWATPIAEMPGGNECLKEFDKEYFIEGRHTIDGTAYKLPYNNLTVKMVYNKDLFKKAGIVDGNGEAIPPKTWDDVIEYAKKITEVGNGNQFGYAMPFGWAGSERWEARTPFASSIGHMGFDFADGYYKYSDFMPMFEIFFKLMDDGSLFPGAATLDNDTARAMFSAGKVGMKMAASWDVGVFNDQFPAQIDWGVADIPVLDPDNRYKEYTLTSGNFAISGNIEEDSEKAKKVMEVYKWLHNDKVLAEYYEEAKLIPYKNEITKLADKQPNKAGWAGFSDTSKGMSYPAEPTGQLMIEGDDFTSLFSKLLLGRIKRENIEEALKELDKKFNASLQKAVDEGKINLDDYIIEDWKEKFSL